MSQSQTFNELGVGEIAVWCRLNPGIDPAQWAYLCRKIGIFSPWKYDVIWY